MSTDDDHFPKKIQDRIVSDCFYAIRLTPFNPRSGWHAVKPWPLSTAPDRTLKDRYRSEIRGGAKERFALPAIVLGLPTTVSGKDHRISFNPGIEVETVQFLCPSGRLTIQIAIQLPD